jgi:hypothetical protein
MSTLHQDLSEVLWGSVYQMLSPEDWCLEKQIMIKDGLADHLGQHYESANL